MTRQNFYGIIFLLAGGLMLTTCHKDYFDLNKLSDEIELQLQLVAPLIYGSMSLDDIVERVDSQGYANEFDDGFIYLVYSDTAFSMRADTMVDIPDKFYTEYYIDSDIDIPIWIGSEIGDTVSFYKSELFAFELDGNDRVDSILIKGGQIVIDVMSSFRHAGILTISSGQILNVDRDTFSTIIEISDPSGGFTDHQIFLSDGYSLKTSEENDTSYLQINFKLDLINSGDPINPEDVCEIQTSFLDLSFYNVFGYIDSRNLIDERGSFDIPLYADNPGLASLIFADPRINIFTSSSIGIPIEIELDSFIATSSRDGSEIELDITEGHPFQIGAPGVDQIGEWIDTEININRETSNIDDIFAAAPSGITYNLIGRTAAGTEADQHFILDTSGLDLTLEFLLPLDFKSSGFSLQDTMEFELGEDGIDTSLVKFAQINMTTLNELPIELMLQVYLLDETYAVIDSVFNADAVLLQASLVDTDGKLNEPMEETNTVAFPAEKLGRLENVSFMLVEARMITSAGGEQFVKLYSQYSLDFEISMLANFRINNRESN
ncbi:MAG: hypothetical protein KAR19_05955 [Bacteroidales bacterium]|nr:hypothetical protein [Bacteroidales bacterium]